MGRRAPSAKGLSSKTRCVDKRFSLKPARSDHNRRGYESFKFASGALFLRAAIRACNVERQTSRFPNNQWGAPPYGQSACLPCDLVGDASNAVVGS